MTGPALRGLCGLVLAEYGGYPDLPPPGDRWVMDLESFRAVIAACKQAGVIYPPDRSEEPQPEDRLFGLPIEVRADGGEPHIVRGRP